MGTGKYRTQPEVVQMFRKAGLGLRQARTGSAISMCEAPVLKPPPPEPTADFGLLGDLDLMDEKWGPSVGGLQVRSLNAERGTGSIRDQDWLLRPTNNIKAAVAIFRERGWLPWSTYTSGKFKAYLPDLYPPPPNTHVVVAGETLSSIAPRYGMTWDELARLNNLHDPYPLSIGQHLLVKEAP